MQGSDRAVHGRGVARVLAAALALAVAACGESGDRGERREGAGPDRPPNLLLVSLDTTRADHTSAYGYERDTTPHLRALAAEGARFELAYAPMATTSPSHATLFTGVYPVTHGVIKNGLPLGTTLPTLAEALAKAGFDTAAVVSSFALDAKWGLARGFGVWEDDFTHAGATIPVIEWEGVPVDVGFDQRADAATERALAWLERARRPDAPFFLFVHYFDPHDPYSPPGDWGARFGADDAAATPLARAISQYDGEIAFTDHEVGRLLDGLDRLGLAEDTIVVIVGDHGEGLSQHGYMMHGAQIYEEAVRVPWLWRWPGRVREGLVVTAPVELVDFVPTVLELAGVPGSGFERQGASLARALRGEEAPPERRTIHLHRRWYPRGHLPSGLPVAGEQFGIRAGPWKLIQAPDEGRLELYDLAADPRETRNLAQGDPDRVRALSQQIADWVDRHRRASAPAPELPEADRKRLEALGYVQ